jgi:heat shock protein HslJ
MRNRILHIISYLIILLSSCEKDSINKKMPSCFNADLNDTIKYEIENIWTFLGFLISYQTEECKPDNIKEMDIEFLSSNKFHFRSSCNSGYGYYKLSAPDSILIDSLATTLMGCISDTAKYWENKYYIGLHNASNYYLAKDILTIKTSSNTSLKFRIDK